MQAFPQPLSAGLFCAPRNLEVVRDDLEMAIARLVRASIRRKPGYDPVTDQPIEFRDPYLYILRRPVLLTAELLSLWWLRPLADSLDHLIRAYRTQPQDVQNDFRRVNRERVLNQDAKKVSRMAAGPVTMELPPLNLPEFIPGQCTPGA